MSRCSQLKTLFCIKIIFGLLNAIMTNEAIFANMSIEEKRSFFGTADGSVPEYELIKMIKPPRTKRTAQTTLSITFNYFGTPSTTVLNIVEDHDLIGRTTTAIWFARFNANAYQNVTYIPRPDLFDRIGEFDFFQNADDGSAVTRFSDAGRNETYIGILKQNYTIKSLSPHLQAFINLTEKYDTRTRSTNSTKDQDENSSSLFVIFKNPEFPQGYLRRLIHGQNASLPDIDMHMTGGQNANPIDLPNVVYPKLLISSDYRSVLRKRNVEAFVKQLIADFNAVDMLYRQLSDPEVRLKIAGIIIPQDKCATPYIIRNTVADIEILLSLNVLHSVVTYFLNERHRFPLKAYDVVIIMTADYLFDYVDLGKIEKINEICYPASACYRANSLVGGAAIMKYATGFEGVATIAHQLGHIFGVDHGQEDTSAECQENDGYTMVTDLPLIRTLRWSTCSQRALKSFFKSESATCMLERPNEVPDAVKSMGGAWLSITGQCENHFNDTSGYCLQELRSCKIYGCIRNDACDWLNHSPLRGTLRYDGKRCIQNRWMFKE